MSDCPSHSSLTAIEMAEKELAQAASVTQLVPPRSSRLAIRPAITLPSTPGKLSSVSRGSTASSASGSSPRYCGSPARMP